MERAHRRKGGRKVASLFELGRVGRLEVKNRLVRSATCEWMCDAEGRPPRQLIDLYAGLAQGGVGLVIASCALATRPPGPWMGHLGIYADSHVDGLRAIAATVHAEGVPIVVQIGMRGMPPVTGMTEAEIADAIAAYGQAARRAKTAGFDGLQLHGAHGNLISCFLSPYVNRRSDRWGGSADNRLSLLAAVCAEVRSEVGADFPVWIKLASQDFVAGGLTPEEGAAIAARLAGIGIGAIEISGGVGGDERTGNERAGIRDVADEGYFRENARLLRRATDLPLMLVGGFRTRAVVAQALDEGMDFVSLSRPLINDPELPNKWRRGGAERAGCISCNLCLKNRDRPLRCWHKYPEG